MTITDNEALELGEHTVRRFARRLGRQDPSLVQDLEQEGRLGLVEAARRFQGRYRVKFMTYATYWVRGKMQHYLRSYGDFAPFDRTNSRRRHVFSLDTDVECRDGIDVDRPRTLGDVLSVPDPTETSDTRQETAGFLARLLPRLRLILFARYGLGLTTIELARAAHLSQRQMSRMCTRALTGLRMAVATGS